MLSGRPRASDTAGRASPTFGRSGNSFFAKIFVFLALSVRRGLGSSDARATGGTITTFGDYVIHNFTPGNGGLGGGGSGSWGGAGDVSGYSGAAFTGGGGGGGGGGGYMLDGGPGGSGVVVVRYKKKAIDTPSCTTSQFLKDGSCLACPPSTGATPSHPSATSTGGPATFCTCPENYYAYAGMNAPSMYDWACQECPVGYSFIKNGSVIPTASGTSDTCDCKAGYYLDNTGLRCNMCAPGMTSAGGRVTECSAIPNSDARATGGTTITTVGDYVIHNFTSNGTFLVTDSSLTEVEVLVVGGAGGGSSDNGGGGGGGAVLYSASKTLSSSPITVTVGNGGTGGWSPGDGGASVFDGMEANGGKAGSSVYSNKAGGASGSGNAGGSGVPSYAGGGGGGDGGPGEAGQQQSEILSYDKGGDGGPGVESAISGTSNYYGGGGGGGVYNFDNRVGSPGDGGLGGGAPGEKY